VRATVKVRHRIVEYLPLDRRRGGENHDLEFVLASLLAISLAAPAFATSEKPADNPAKGKGWHCRKLANEKYHIQDGRALNKAVGAAIQRCKQTGRLHSSVDLT